MKIELQTEYSRIEGRGVFYVKAVSKRSKVLLEKQSESICKSKQELEVMALFEILSSVKREFEFPKGERIIVETNSIYLYRSFNEWIEKWTKNGYRKAKGSKIAHEEFWREIKKYKDEYNIMLIRK